jgi:hypothetical protein
VEEGEKSSPLAGEVRPVPAAAPTNARNSLRVIDTALLLGFIVSIGR